MFKVLLSLFSLGLFGLILGRLNQPLASANLLVNPEFQMAELSRWQTAKVGQAQAIPRLSTDKPDHTLLTLEIPDTAEGSWVGVGQRLAISSLQRYRLLANYRLVDAAQSSAKLVLRVSQFDQDGRVIKAEEISDSEPLVTQQLNEQRVWTSQTHTFVTDERTVAVEIGVGLFGTQATRIEIDKATLELYPTGLGKLKRDNLALAALLGLTAVIGYGVGRILWPFRRQVIVNTGLAATSLLLTLIVAEILVRFIPINLISPNWPAGYHIPSLNGKSYRLAANYPTTYVTDNSGDRHLVMSNSVGVRDVEIPQDNDETIILVLGDSMTFGWAISDINETWPRRLDAEIEQMIPTSDYHFVNAGLSGYNTFQEVFLFQTLIKDLKQKGVKPKIALLSFFSGIWERNLYGPDGRFTILNGVLMYSSVKQALLELAGRLVDKSQFDDLKLIGANRLNTPHQFLLLKSRLYFILSLLLVNQLDENWDALSAEVDPVTINYEALQSFREVAKANGIQPIVAYLPADNLFTPTKLEKNRDLIKQLAEMCQNLGITFLNPYENMEKLGINGQNSKQKLTLIYNRHYNPTGNLLYAQALAPLLADYLARQIVNE